MKIAHKLLLLIVLGLSGCIVMGGVSLWQLSRMNTEVDAAYDSTVPSIMVLGGVLTDYYALDGQVKQHLLTKDATQKAAVETEIGALRQSLNKGVADYAPLLWDDKDRELYAAVKQQLALAEQTFTRVVELSRQNQDEEASAVLMKSQAQMQQVLSALDAHMKYNVDWVAIGKKNANEIAANAQMIMLAVALAMLLLLGVSGLLIYRQIAGDLGRAQQTVGTIRQTLDFTTRIPLRGGDEISAMLGEFNALMAQMQQSLKNLQGGASEVAQLAGELSGAAGHVSHGSQTQSASAATMAAALEQMTVSINHVADRTREADGLCRQAGSEAQGGALAIGHTVSNIEAISTSVSDASGELTKLDTQSREIETMINVIRDVAEQTNLLALNAAIEAARAGESGRGFAVVADEVRKLAERTAGSTRDIAQIVAGIRSVSAGAVASMQQAVGKVEEGQGGVSQAQHRVAGIVSASANSSELVGEIAVAIGEQSMAANSIASQVESVAHMAEENSAAAAQAAAQAEQLGLLAQRMRGEVALYKL
ncbi:methyl-accepting chemotaxis protein [Aquitalea sp. S1-19]|nr:methyl-accepting chemotaxis protein [Aquitalea sp. S1-19]